MTTNDQEAIKEAAEKEYPRIIGTRQVGLTFHTINLNAEKKEIFIAGATSEAAKNYWLNELGKQQGDGWISVEERLPEKDNEEYLVFGCEVVSTLNWIKGKWYSDVLGMFVGNDSITHWRPLPQPPKQ